MPKRAVPTPIARERLEELRKRPSDAITLARIKAGEMAWLLDLALERREGKPE
jgi:hypothetical protein